jgi:hypothetical protein
MSSTPDYPNSNTQAYDPNSELSIKIAGPEIILGEESLGEEIMFDLVYDQIGAQEIINISRHDLINGQSVIYQPIKNITNLYYQYNPQNILALQDTDREYFKRFSIDLSKNIPECGSGYDIIDGVSTPNCKYVYIDPQTGSLVVDVVNILPGQDIEIQIMSEGYLLDDTIYEEES